MEKRIKLSYRQEESLLNLSQAVDTAKQRLDTAAIIVIQGVCESPKGKLLALDANTHELVYDDGVEEKKDEVTKTNPAATAAAEEIRKLELVKEGQDVAATPNPG